MKVLIVTMALDIGGAETHVYHLAMGLKKIGIEPIVMSKGGVYATMLIEGDIRHIEAPLDKKDINSLMTSIRRLKKVIKDEEIDLIHAHGRIPALVSKWVSKRTHLPFLVTAHAKVKVNLLYRVTSFWGDKTISISEDIRQHLIDKFGVAPNRITLIENGIDTEIFKKKVDNEQKKKPHNSIVFMSRLDASLGKMCMKVIDAIVALDKKGLEVFLDIIGDGVYLPVLQKHVASLQLNKSKITLLGKRTNVYDLLPNHTMAICVGRSAMEAMACELPIILAGGEGYMGILTKEKIEEAIRNNLTGRGHFPQVTVDQIEQDIHQLLFQWDEKKRETMGQYNRKIITDKYSLEQMIQKTVAIYERLRG